MRYLRPAMLGLALLAMAISGEPCAADRLLPDAVSQEEIRAMVEGLASGPGSPPREEALAVIVVSSQRPTAERVHLLQQVAIYLAGSQSTRESMGGAVLFHALEFQREEIVSATLPHLVEAAPELNKVLRELIASTLPDAPGEEASSLVLQVEAWRTGRATGGGDVGTPGLASRRADIGEMLTALSENESLWVKAYARTVVRVDPQLVSAETRSKLEQD